MGDVRHAIRADLDTVADVLGEAFEDDPIAAWVWPERDGRRETMRAFFDIVARAAFERGHVYLHDRGAAAIWSPPDVEAMDDEANEAVATLLQTTVPDQAHLGRVVEGFEGFYAGHPADPPHFYLYFVGSRVPGAGYGTALLDDMLRRCDAHGLMAYLEASSPRNRPLYERQGFRTFDEYHFPDGPPIWRMWREPQV